MRYTKVNINKKKLEELIAQEMDDVNFGGFCEGRFAIGEFCGMQVQVVVIKADDEGDADDWVDTIQDAGVEFSVIRKRMKESK